MKYIIPVAIFALMLMVTSVAAGPGMPSPISGAITPVEIGNHATVIIENTATGHTVEFETVGHYYMVDWSSTGDDLKSGDEFTVTVYNKVEKFIWRGSPVVVNFDFSECPVIDCADCLDCPDCDCPPVYDCPDCPTCPDCVCDECDVCEDCEDCTEPTENYDWAWAAVVAGLVGAGGSAVAFRNRILMSPGAGIKTYRGRNGELRVLHKHKGIKGYHSPDTSHRDAWERHPRGKLDPNYEFSDSKMRWEYIG